MLNVTPEKKHMVRKKTCGCKICKYNNDPVDLRIVRKHIQKYGLHVEKFEDSTYSDCQNSNSRQCPVEVCDRPPSEPDVDNEPLSPVSEVGHGSEDDEVPEQVNTSNQSGSESETENESEMESESEMEEEANSLESEWCSKYDTTLYEADIAVKKIFHTNLTLLEWLTLQFDMFSSHTMSKSMFTHNLKVQKLIHGDTENLLPSSYYQARRLVDPFIIKKKVFSVCVNDCVLFRDSSKYSYKHLDKCPVCGEDRYVKSTTKRLIPKRKFIYIPIGPRIGRMFGDVNLSQLVLSHPGNNYQSEQGTDKDMWDVHHSSTWNEVYSAEGYFKGNKSGLSYAIELDGVNPFHNIGVRYSMTPIMLTLLNLPRHVRNSFGNINLVGIIPCNGKSESVNMDPFLEVLVDELLYLTGCKAYCAYYKAPVNIKIKLLLYILDYPGLSKVFHQHGSGSLLGCHWCLIRGKRCSHLDKVIYLSNRSYLQKADPIRKDTVHFLDQKEDKSGKPEPRSIETESSYRMAYEKAKNKAQAACVATATGCKKGYPLSCLPGHNRISESHPDACHTIKDVVQNIMNLVAGNKVDICKIVTAEKQMNRLHNLHRTSSVPVDTCTPTPSSETATSVLSKGIKGKRKQGYQNSGTSAKKPKLGNGDQTSNTVNIPTKDLPFLLTRDELKTADNRANSIRVPLGFGLKPSPFISKSGCLKSHDWKQLATHGIIKFCLKDTLEKRCRQITHGIIKFCLKDTLEKRCRQTLFLLLDCITDICQERVTVDEIDIAEVKLNKALVLLEKNFPLHLQNITTHILHHIPDSIRRYGPVYGTWMFVFERFNSWICKRVTNMRYPEATAIETFLIHDWCQYMFMSGRVSRSLDSLWPQDPFLDETIEVRDDSERLDDKKKQCNLGRRSIKSIHMLCGKTQCGSCSFKKYFHHREIHPITKRVQVYTCESRELKSSHTVSSYVCHEIDRGLQQQKVVSGKFIDFGRIQYFIEHQTRNCGSNISNSNAETLAYVNWIDNIEFDKDTGIWFTKQNDICAKSENLKKGRCSFILTKSLSCPLVTAVENQCIWFLDSGKTPFLTYS